MSKKLPDNFMDSFLSGKTPNTERTQREHKENTERTQKPDYDDFKASDLVTFSIRMRVSDLAVLRDHFQRIDVPISQGVRQIVLDWMERNRLM